MFINWYFFQGNGTILDLFTPTDINYKYQQITLILQDLYIKLSSFLTHRDGVLGMVCACPSKYLSYALSNLHE